jgi:hypothetical protein
MGIYLLVMGNKKRELEAAQKYFDDLDMIYGP